MKNLALVIPNLQYGGAERVVSRLSQLMSTKYNVYIVVFDAGGISYEYSGTLIDMKLKAEAGLFSKAINIIKRVIRLRKIKKTYGIDTAISFLDAANLINILSRKKDKVVISIRNFKGKEMNTDWQYWLHMQLARFLYRFADKIIAVSRVIEEDIANRLRLNKNKLSTIYNPYDIENILNLAVEPLNEDEKAFLENKKVIVSVGRLVHQKGFWHLIKIFKKVKEIIPDAGLLIIGDGPVEERLKKLAADCGLSEDIRFAGYVKNPYKYVSRCRAYAMTSLFEGFPNALVEAMACSIPVVSADCKSGPREILYENPDLSIEAQGVLLADYGILAPAFNDAENWDIESLEPQETIFTHALIKLLTDEELYKSYREGSKKRASDFSYERCLKDFDEICK